jgi:hypothetical protein
MKCKTFFYENKKKKSNKGKFYDRHKKNHNKKKEENGYIKQQNINILRN